MNKLIPALVLVVVLGLTSGAGAAMGGSMMPGFGGNGTAGSGPMMGGGFMMTNNGGFGMMEGMAGAPVVGDDGTAFIVTHNPTAYAGPVPDSSSFQSTVSAVSPSGQIITITLNGIVSRPVVADGILVATASLPEMSNFNLAGSLGTNATGQSVLYAMQLPLTSASVPVAVTMDGEFSSMPVLTNNRIYVTTTDFGSAMMTGDSTFNAIYGSYNFNSSGTASSYLYIVNLDGTPVVKVRLQ